jgi:hypothetical protein
LVHARVREEEPRRVLDEAIVLAHSGVISLLRDHVIVHPGFVEDSTPLNEQQIAVGVQQDVNIVLNGVAGEPSGLAEMCVETEFK